ncbi:MAG TPA: dihydrofolate reductase family protein, partial [Thermomicrobiaceae bacterium]|nr:dihydrofolate reductase family protein [Thermomicrobiaceae bacterium]
QHRWTPDYVFPPLAGEYRALRQALGKPPAPLTAIVTASGQVDLGLPVFRAGAAPVLLITTAAALDRLPLTNLPPGVSAVAAGSGPTLTAREVLDAVMAAGGGDTVLLEAGPRLMAQFLDQGQVDELFLTLSPQIAGRVGPPERPGFAMGVAFAPDRPLWTHLVDVRRGGSHLFLRYALS